MKNILTKEDRKALLEKTQGLFFKVVYLIRQALGIEKQKIHFLFCEDSEFCGSGECNYGFDNGKCTIKIKKKYLESENLFKILLHEMNHAAQFFFGYLSYNFATDSFVWMNQAHPNTFYKLQPWEVDSRKFEKRYLEFVKLAKDL